MSSLDIEKLAGLAKLSLSKEKEIQTEKELNQVIEYFNVIKEAKLDDLEPLLSPSQTQAALREDRAESFESSEGLLSNAPETLGRLYKTPPIV